MPVVADLMPVAVCRSACESEVYQESSVGILVVYI